MVQTTGHHSCSVSHPGTGQFDCRFSVQGAEPPSDWSFHPAAFARLARTLGPLDVDLFASALNALPGYCSRVRDPAAWKIDAFSFPWTGFKGYAFPPIPLIPRVLRKIREDRAQVVLIAPRWPRRTWFLDLTDLLTGPPTPLPCRPDLISQPISQARHQQLGALHLTAWPLSGVPALRRAFQNGPLP